VTDTEGGVGAEEQASVAAEGAAAPRPSPAAATGAVAEQVLDAALDVAEEVAEIAIGPDVPFVSRLAPAALTTALGALAATAALFAMPFLARLDAPKASPPSPEVWGGFVGAALLFGGAAGLTPIVPWRFLRFGLIVPVVAAAVGSFALAAFVLTLDGLSSFSEVLALLFLSPLYIATGVLYAGIIAIALIAISLLASLLASVLRDWPVRAVAVAAGLAWVAVVVLILAAPGTAGWRPWGNAPR
jgi:hypothetical protein